VRGVDRNGQRLEDRRCGIYGCTNVVLCRQLCQIHYVQRRRWELEGLSAAAIAALEPHEPPKKPWVWPGDEQFLIDRLENDDQILGITEQEEHDNECN
jgi:hypothetical protein